MKQLQKYGPRTIVIVVAAALFVGQAAQLVASRFEADAALRDIVADEEGYAYLAAFDRNEIWKIRISDGERVATVDVGDGPAALALSHDGQYLLSVNRNDATATILDRKTLETVGETGCGEGASAVAALPGGGFAVVNSFADSITLIDPLDPADTVVLEDVAAVPNGIACSDTYLAVTTKSPPALLLYSGGDARPQRSIPLPSEPVAIAAMNESFVVGMRDCAAVITTDGIVSDLPVDSEIFDVCALDDRMRLLTAGSVLEFDRDLSPIRSLRVEDANRSIANIGANQFAVVSPQDRSWHVAGPAAAPAEADSSEPHMAEVEKPEVDLYSRPITQGEPEAALSVATLDAAIVRKEKSEENIDRLNKSLKRIRVAQAETLPEESAPPSPRRPSASPLDTPSDPTLLEGAAEDVQAAGEGFTPPDWSQPIRNMTAEELESFDGGTKLFGKGNVNFSIDTMDITADEVYFDDVNGELRMIGNVEIRQGISLATADEMYYVLPPPSERRTPPLVSDNAYMEEDLADTLMRLGNLDATNLEIIEPNRKLKAMSLTYDFETQTGIATDVEGESGQVRFGGKKLTLNPDGTAEGQDLWLTTCDCDSEYYRIRVEQVRMREDAAYLGKGAQLELGNRRTPVYWPRWRMSGGERPTIGVDFDSGRTAELGYYVNVGQQFAVNEDLELGIRFFPTTRQGIGFGVDGQYDYMTAPYSNWFRSQGEFHALVTTKERGYYEWFHRHELTPDTVLLANIEQWGDEDFYKDFYYDRYKDRSEPRNFVNVTHIEEETIVTATASKNTHDFVAETEKMPEVTAHVLERQIADRLYFTFDTINGYYEREPASTNSARTVNVARLTYDIEMGQALNLTPFAEAELAGYSKTRDDGDSDVRFTTTAGITAQTRLHRNYGGRWGFESFRHLVVPSFTYSYRAKSDLDVEDTPRFDAYDNVYGRSRLETKIDNILLGRDAETQIVWPVARLSLYVGHDFWNELRESEDYELELDIRPRPHWGINAIAERHTIREDANLDDPFFVQNAAAELYERITGDRVNPEANRRYNAQYADYDRVIAMLYYDDTANDGKFSGRLGFAYTKTLDEVFNREILYGMGYKLGEKWSMSFEHRYDFERNELVRQEYELRRELECVEAAIQARERESGWDLGLEFSITAFPGTSVKF